MDLRQRLLNHLVCRIGKPLALRLVFWDGKTFDFGATPVVTVTLATPRLAGMMMRGDLDALCDAYVAGDILVDGTVQDILTCGIEFAEAIGRLPFLPQLAKIGRMLPAVRTRKQDAANVRFHYDVSNDFYKLWLDSGMIYSCAYFRDGREDIDRAQQQKLDHICRKLQLQQGDRFLDVGCGWGGLVLWAVKKYGVTGLGATISPSQGDYAQSLAKREIVAGGRAEFRLQDYRDIAGAGSFDKIASVGMYEHVGLCNLQAYFNQMTRLLKPAGTLLNHGIFLPNVDGKARGPRVEFIGRHVFPGGELPTLPEVMRCILQAGLEIADFEDLRPHYVRTLSLWLSRLEAKKQEAIQLAGAERYRIWRMFLGGMAYAFDAGWLSVGQIVAYKPDASRAGWRPWSREHQYNTSRQPTLAARLNWREAEDCDAAHV